MKTLRETLKESLLDDFGSQTKDLRKEQIKEWLKDNNKFGTDGLRFNPDGTIDIDDFVYAGKGNFPDFIQFNKCIGNFYVRHCEITSLRGCPKEVRGVFSCAENNLKDLTYGPKKVKRDYFCYGCKLISLKGAPKEIGGDFYCSDNDLKSYKYGPMEIDGNLYCGKNKLSKEEIRWIKDNVEYHILYENLDESLLDDFEDQAKDAVKRRMIADWLAKNNKDRNAKFTINPDYTIDIDRFIYGGKGNFPEFIQFRRCGRSFACMNKGMTSLRGCPEYVRYSFDCSLNPLKSLEGGPKTVEDEYDCSSCNLDNFEGGPEIVGSKGEGTLDIYDNHIEKFKIPKKLKYVVISRGQLDKEFEKKLKKQCEVQIMKRL